MSSRPKFATQVAEAIDFSETGPGNKVWLFRRALLRRNIRVINPPKRKGDHLPVWGAAYKGEVELFRGLMSADRGMAAHRLARDKATTKSVLQEAGLRVPTSYDVGNAQSDPDGVFAEIQSLGLIPGVLKPNGGSHGRGVTMGIRDIGGFRKALEVAGNSAIFEEQIFGRDYRMLTIGSSLKAVTERKPSHVIGDGVSTVAQLVSTKNERRVLNPSTRNHPLLTDEHAELCLSRQGLSLHSVPSEGVEVLLRTVANVGSGGDAHDRTDQVHPGFTQICERVPEHFGSPEVLGIDIIAEDISADPEGQKWGILEVNANPDIDLQHWPWSGEGRDVADQLARTYFPDSHIGKTDTIMLEVRGKLRYSKLENWVERYSVLAGLGVLSFRSERGLQLSLTGTEAAVDWFVEMLIRSRTGSIIRSIDCTTAAGS